MEHGIYTLHDFMKQNEDLTYILLGVSLVLATLAWMFLTERDDDE